MRMKLKQKKIPKPNFDFKPVEKAMDTNAEEMKNTTIELAPEDTGNLKESILKKKIEGGSAVYLEVNRAHYGFYQEHGWQAPTRFIPGKFFFENAFLRQEVQLEDDMNSVIDKVIKIK